MYMIVLLYLMLIHTHREGAGELFRIMKAMTEFVVTSVLSLSLSLV